VTALPTARRRQLEPGLLAAADAWPESELQKGVLQRCGAFGWRRVHFLAQPVVNRRGGVRHVTPFIGDAGWPDTVMVHDAGVLVVVELKQEGKYPDSDQREWLDRLAAVPGILAGVWRPRDWFAHVIDDVLSDPERSARIARGAAA